MARVDKIIARLYNLKQKQKQNTINRKTFFESKAFGIIAIAYGVLGILILAHHMGSYEAMLRPGMDYLIENKIITNNIKGITFLYFFTNQSNIFAICSSFFSVSD